MAKSTTFSLISIRTDGWFERVGEKVGSFEALCNILGERFFAFSLITGARVTSLTVDRRNPTASVVEFEVSGAGSATGPVTQRLTLDRFRRRLVSALLAEETQHPMPKRETDIEGIQLFIGVRYLLLAPLFGYSLLELTCEGGAASVAVNHDGERRVLPLPELRATLRRWVLEELDRASSAADPARSGLDLSILPEAKAAADALDAARVVSLLGGWLMPLSFYHRTPEGRLLTPEVKAELAAALGLLGEALLETGDLEAGQQSLRLSVQYAVDTDGAADAYARLGEWFLRAERSGEAIAPLRRAVELGAAPERVWPALGLALFQQERLLAAWGAIQAGGDAGVAPASFAGLRARVLERLPALEAWQALVPDAAE